MFDQIFLSLPVDGRLLLIGELGHELLNDLYLRIIRKVSQPHIMIA